RLRFSFDLKSPPRDVRNLRRPVLIFHEITSLDQHGAANSHNLYAIVEHLVGLQRSNWVNAAGAIPIPTTRNKSREAALRQGSAKFVIDTQLDGWRKGAGSQHYVYRPQPNPSSSATPTRLPVRNGDLDRPLHPVRFVRPSGASVQD